MRKVCLGANVKADEDAVHPHRVSTLSDAGNRANARDRRPATRGTPPSTLSATSLLMTRPPRPPCIIVCRQRAWIRAGGNLIWGQQMYASCAAYMYANILSGARAIWATGHCGQGTAAHMYASKRSGARATGRARDIEDLRRGARLGDVWRCQRSMIQKASGAHSLGIEPKTPGCEQTSCPTSPSGDSNWPVTVFRVRYPRYSTAI